MRMKNFLHFNSQDSSSSSDDSTDVDDERKKDDIRINEFLSVPVPVPKIDKILKNECQICSGPERCNPQNKPEIFVSCSTCKRNG